MGLLKLFFISIILMPVIAAPPPPLPATSDSEKDPVEKKKLLVMALGNDQESKMLKSELFRDWTKPNSEVILSKKQAEQNLKLGKLLNSFRDEIQAHYDIKILEGIDVPINLELAMFPYIKIGSGKFESLDKRAFSDTTMPLLTMKYYCDATRESYLRDEEEKKYEELNLLYSINYNKIRNQIIEKVAEIYKPPKDYTQDISVYGGGQEGTIKKVYGYDQKTQRWEIVLDGVHYNYTEVWNACRELDYLRYHYVHSKFSTASIGLFDEKNNRSLSGKDIVLSEARLNINLDIPIMPFPYIAKELRPPWKEGSTYSLEYFLDPPAEAPSR